MQFCMQYMQRKPVGYSGVTRVNSKMLWELKKHIGFTLKWWTQETSPFEGVAEDSESIQPSNRPGHLDQHIRSAPVLVPLLPFPLEGFQPFEEGKEWEEWVCRKRICRRNGLLEINPTFYFYLFCGQREALERLCGWKAFFSLLSEKGTCHGRRKHGQAVEANNLPATILMRNPPAAETISCRLEYTAFNHNFAV